MIAKGNAGIRMYHDTERAMMDGEPWYQSPELRWGEDGDLELADGMGTDWFVMGLVDD